MIIVSNAGPLIALAKIGHFELLRRIFGRLSIPQAVYHEVAVRGIGRPGADEIRQALGHWIEVLSVQDTAVVRSFSTKLGLGESEAIALAMEVSAELVLLDDGKARAVAEFMGLDVSGTVGVLIQAYRIGLLADLRQTLDELRAKGFRLDEQIYTDALTRP